MSKLDISKNETESFSTKKTLNNSHKLLVGALALILVAGMASPAFALVVDDFGSDTMAFTAAPVGGTNSDTNTGLPASETIGQERTVDIEHTGGQLLITVNINPPAGVFAFSGAAQTKGDATITYNGIANVGLGGIDLTDGGASDRINLTFLSADFGSDVIVSITDTSGDTISQTLMAGGGPQVLEFKFVNMVGTGDQTTPTDADKIVVTLVGEEMGDYQIDLITIPQMRVGGTVGSMSTATLLVAGAQANMGLWSLALVGIVGAGAAIIYKKKSKKTEQ